jgi:hypothetical protein
MTMSNISIIIEYASRLGRTDALKDLLDIIGFLLITPEIAGEERIRRLSEFAKANVEKLTYISPIVRDWRIMYPIVVPVWCFVGTIGPVYTSGPTPQIELMEPGPLFLRFWQSLLTLLVVAVGTAVSPHLVRFMISNAVTRHVFFASGVLAFFVARGLGVWDAIKNP